ncbi:MAG: hypothetical protein AAFQ94_19920 [Bacteroidota bacterium]
MKRTITTFIKGAVLALLVLVSQSSAFASSEPDVISKAREAVASAPDNWYILASSAEACFENHTNLEEAKKWIDKSISLQKNKYTLQVMGDYYMESEQPKKALEYYVLSLQKAKEGESKTDVKAQQAKIAKAYKKIKASE